jgi:4-amino-4-deoxy-L-arabinose transferase-like glycosyltransferase
MSATITRPAAPVSRPTTRERVTTRAIGDRTVVTVLVVLFAGLVAVTWRKWGMPEGDAGAELTTADLIKHGALAYRDVRYFYGPLGLYSLALAFKMFGTSFTVAYGFGLAQAAAIFVSFYVLARQWLAPLVAGLSTAVLLGIGFSGNSFNFILPHTNSATFGILTLLLMLLALRRGQLAWAGVAAGLVALTRPEFLAVAAGTGVAYLIAAWRIEGRQAALAAAWRLAVPSIGIAVVVYGWFAAKVGLHNLLFENLWPAKFLQAGIHTESNWMPLSLASVFGLLARAAVYGGLLAGLVLSAEKLSGRKGIARIGALWPLAAAAVVLAVGDGALRAAGLFSAQRVAMETEIKHLIVGMSWLPASGVGVFVWSALQLRKRREAPLGGSWAADFALIVAAVGLGLRAYNAFTAEGSYAPYYAAPLVLLLGILHARIAAERPRARTAALGALGLAAVGLVAYSLVGMYRHLDAPVHTPRGTFVTFASAAPALQRAVNTIDADSRPGDSILAAPIDGGMYFFADRKPASYELTLLPGLLPDRASQLQAIARLRRDHASVAVLSARQLSVWGSGPFGVGYDKLVGDYLRSNATSVTTVGSLAQPAAGTLPSHGFTILRLRSR